MAKSSFRDLSDPRNTRKRVQELANKVKESRANELSLDSGTSNLINDQKALEKKLKEEEERQRREEEEQRRREELERKKKEQKENENEVENSENEENKSETILDSSISPFETEEGLANKSTSLEKFSIIPNKEDFYKDETEEEKANRESNERYLDKLKGEIVDPLALAGQKYESDMMDYYIKTQQGEEAGRGAKALALTRAGLTGLGGVLSNYVTWAKIAWGAVTGKTMEEAEKKEEEKQSFQSELNTNGELLANTDGLDETKKELEGFEDTEEGKEAVALVNLWNGTQEHEKAMMNLIDAYNKEVEVNGKDSPLAQSLLKQYEYHQLEYYRDRYEYAFGETIEGSTLKELLNNVKKTKKGSKYKDDELLSFNITEFQDRLNSGINAYSKYADLSNKFIIRGNYNVGRLPVEKMIRTIEGRGVLLGDDVKDMIATPYVGVEDELQSFDMQITNAYNENDEKKASILKEQQYRYKQGMSYLTSYLENSAIEIADAGGKEYMNDTYMAIAYLYKSKETQDLKKLLTDPETYKQFIDEKGNLDYVALGNYIENSEELRNFGALSLAYKSSAKNLRLDQQLAETETGLGFLYRGTREEINELYVRGPREAYRDSKYNTAVWRYLSDGGDISALYDDDSINKILGDDYDFTSVSQRKLLTDMIKINYDNAKNTDGGKYRDQINESYLNPEGVLEKSRKKGDVVTDRISDQIKSEDFAYATDYWYAVGNVIENIGDRIQADPGSTLLTAAAVALPFLGGADAIGTMSAKLAAGLGAGPSWVATWRGLGLLAGEALEGEVINILLDSTSYGEADPRWNLLDVGIGALRAAPYVKQAKAIGKMQSETKSIVKDSIKKIHGSATSYSSLTKEEQKAVDREMNRLFNLNGDGLYVNAASNKKLSDYMKDGELDMRELYKDYDKGRLKYLGITGDEIQGNIGKAIQMKAFYDELGTMDPAIVDRLYRRAASSLRDKELIQQLLKGSREMKIGDQILSGKKAVVGYWLQQNLNTFKKIGNTKAGVYLTKIFEGSKGGLSSELNKVWQARINILEGIKSKAKNPSEVELIDDLIDSAKELWANNRMLPLYVSEKSLDSALELNKIKTEEFHNKIQKAIDSYAGEKANKEVNESLFKEESKATREKITELEKLNDAIKTGEGLPPELLKAYEEGGLEGVARYILGNSADLEKVGYKVYNIKELSEQIQNISDKMLTKGAKARLEQLLNLIDGINKGTIDIIQLPANIKNSILGIQGFMGYLKKGTKADTVIAFAAGLVGGTKTQSFESMKALLHEIGHTIFLSLNEKARSQIVLGLIASLKGQDITSSLLKRYVPHINSKRVDFLKQLYKKKDATEFVEELCADMLSNSIYEAIVGGTNAGDTLIDNLISQMAKGNKVLTDASKTAKPSQILGNKFTDMLESLFSAITEQRSEEEFRGIMNYIAASILEGQEVEVKSTKSLKEAQKNLIFGRKDKKYYGGQDWFEARGKINEPKYKGQTLSDFDRNIDVTDYDEAIIQVKISELMNIMKDYQVDFDTAKALMISRYPQGTDGIKYLLDDLNPKDFEFLPNPELSIIDDEKWGVLNNKFYEYREKQNIVNKADFNTQKEIGDELSALDKDITSFDIAKVHSTTTIKELLGNPKVTAEELGQMMSTKWMSIDFQSEVLKNVSKKDFKKFQKAVDFAQTKQQVMGKLLTQFWKNGQIDLTKEIDGYTFADIVNNISVKTTKNGYVEFGGIDLIKFLNSSDREAYEDLFYRVMSNLNDMYDPKVISEIQTKLTSAGIKGSELAGKVDDDFAAIWIAYTNRVQKSIYNTAISAGIDKEIAKSLSEDTISRMFAGSFYYMSNVYYAGMTDFSTLVDDMAYGLILKNKKYAKGDNYNTLYELIEQQYKKSGTMDESFSRRLSSPRTAEFASSKNATESFRRRWYEREVFNRLAARTEEYIIQGLKDMAADREFLRMSKQDWTEFFNKAFTRQSQTQTLIGGIFAEKGITSDMLGISSKLNSANTTSEIADVYIDALNKSNPKVDVILSDSEKQGLIKRLENIRDNGLSDSDYDNLLQILENKYMNASFDDLSLDDYFRGVLSIDQINELNKKEENFAQALVNSVDPYWPDEVVKEFSDIGTILDEPEVKEAIEKIGEEINTWNNLVQEGEAGNMNTIMKYVLQNDAFKPFFDIVDTKNAVKFKMFMTTSSNADIQRVVTVTDSLNTSRIGKLLTQAISWYVNPTSMAAKDKELGDLLTKGIDFVNNKRVYVKEGAISDFFKIMQLDGGEKWYTVKSIVNRIINVFGDCLKEEGITFKDIADDIVNIYTTRFPTYDTTKGVSVGKTRRTADELREFNMHVSIPGELGDKYKAAINAYVEILSKRHADSGRLSKVELNKIMGGIGQQPKSMFLNWNSWGSMKANEASKLLGLNGYWLGLSSTEISKLDKRLSKDALEAYEKAIKEGKSVDEALKESDAIAAGSAIYHPDLFKNYLYKIYSRTDKTYNTIDKLLKGGKWVENKATQLMYFIYYNVFGSGIPSATQQIATNYLEVASKTLGELADFDIDTKTYNDLMGLVGDLIPSELLGAKRAELDMSLAGLSNDSKEATNRVIGWLGQKFKNFSNISSSLYWADRSAESAVFRYSLVSALMNAGFNGDSTRDLVKLVSNRVLDLKNRGVSDNIIESVLKADPKKVGKYIDTRIDKLINDGKMSAADGMLIKNKLKKLNEASDPLRTVAKNANYQKNAFYQISQTPELVQNMLAGWGGPQNMRFFNWATRKAGEYAYNIADAFIRGDKQAFYQYLSSLAYRGLIATKIYAQLDKATTNTGGVNYFEFMKTLFLPYTVINMALGSALDIVRDSVADIKGGKGVLNTLYDNLLSVKDNLKGRLSSSVIYWAEQFMSLYNGAQMFKEKSTASQYLSGPLASIPVVNWVAEAIEKIRANRITRFTSLSVGGVSKNSMILYDQNKMINLFFGGYFTNDIIGAKKLKSEADNAMYADEKEGLFDFNLLDSSRDSSMAYRAYWNFVLSKGLDRYYHPGTDMSSIRAEFDKYYDEKNFYDSLEQLGRSIEEYQSYLIKNYETNGREDSTMPGFDKLADEKGLKATYWADTVLNGMLMKGASYAGMSDAGEGGSEQGREDWEDHVIKLQTEIQEEINAKYGDSKALKNAAYNGELISDIIRKYGNKYGEEILIATTIKAYLTSYKTKERDKYKKEYGNAYAENLYDKFDIQKQTVTEKGINTLIEEAVAAEKNRMVEAYYPIALLGNEYIANVMLPVHAALLPDYPLASSVNLKSAMGVAVDVAITRKNVMYQGLSNVGMDGLVPEYLNRVMNSTKLSWLEKFEYMENVNSFISEYYNDYWQNIFKAGISIPITKNFTELYNAAIAAGKDTSTLAEYVEEGLNYLTVSRPLSDEDIKQEVRDEIFKKQKTGSGSGSKGRKGSGSISFDKLADNLTKFQAFKRMFERNVMGQEPLNRIAYKATSHGVTPIQLSVGEAHEIDQKYTFITPKQPESEKTPDIVVKQVKTSTSKYSGKAIKQSNVYKVKKIL